MRAEDEMAQAWEPHAILKIPPKEEFAKLSKVDRLTYFKQRRELIKLEKEEPFEYGFELPSWKRADEALRDPNISELLIQGGNRSSKSEWAAKRVVEALCHNPNAVIWCFSMNHDNSVQMQQRYIYKYLPDQYKKVGKGKIAYVKFNYKNGFTDNRFILPNGAECVFRNYSQELRTIEGGETGSKFWDPDHARVPDAKRGRIHNIGVWADELIPLDFVETLRYRILDRSAKMMITFTAVDGYSPTVKEYLVGAKTLKSAPAPLLDGRKLPILQQCKRKSAKIVYFHTSENPYAGYAQMVQTLTGAPEDEILCRAYGVPTKPVKSKFPKFRDTVNVMPLKDIPFMIPHPTQEDRYLVDKTADVTIYHGVDPAGSKPWFMLWAGVTPTGTYFFAEYPDISYGKWADVTKGARGVYGEACRPNGYGIQDYVDLIKDIELEFGIEDVFERIIDPRFGVAKRSNHTAATSIVDDMQAAGMEMLPAQLKTIDDGIQDVNDMLTYNDQKPIDSMNAPKLYMSETCENLIYSMQEYTGEFGKDEVTKDPIDTMRYIVGENACFIGNEDLMENDTTRRY